MFMYKWMRVDTILASVRGRTYPNYNLARLAHATAADC